MKTSIYFWLLCLLWLFFAYGLISSAVIVVTGWLRKKENVSEKFTIINENIRLMAVSIVKIGLGMVIGAAAIDLWQYHHTFVLWDLKVAAEPGDQVVYNGKPQIVPPDTFYFQKRTEPTGQVFPFTFCKQYVPGLKVGDHVDVIVATQQYMPVKCQNVAPKPDGIVYHSEEGGE